MFKILIAEAKMTKIESIKDHQKVYYRESITEKYDLSFSIVLQHLYYHITSNENKKIRKAYKDNRYWYYATYRQISCSTGLSISQVERSIKKIFREEILIEGNHNAIKSHQRKWFTLGNIKDLHLSEEKPLFLMLNNFVNNKPQPALLHKTLSFLMESFGVESELSLTLEDISNFLKKSLTTRQVSYWANKLVENGILIIRKISKKLSTFMFTNDVYSQNNSDKSAFDSDKSAFDSDKSAFDSDKSWGGNTRKNKEVFKEVYKEQCNTRKREHCFSIKEINELKILEPSLKKSYIGYLLKKFSLEKLKELIIYCQEAKPICVGSYLRVLLKNNPSGLIPKKENIALAKEYFGKYEILITRNYVKITNDIELFFYQRVELFRELFLSYIEKAIKKKGICENHNKRLVEKLRNINYYAVKSVNSYQVVINSFNSQLILDLYMENTEGDLEELIEREQCIKDESNKKVSTFKTVQDLEDSNLLDRLLQDEDNLYEKYKYKTGEEHTKYKKA